MSANSANPEFTDDYFINFALMIAARHLDSLERKKERGPFCVKREFDRVFESRTGKQIQGLDRKQAYYLDE